MKKLALIIALLLPVAVYAQDNETGARASVGINYKIQKGLHLTLEEELRIGDGLDNIDRLQTTIGLTYKPVKFIKLGAGYSLINPYKQSWGKFNYPRHRFFFSAAGYLSAGDFQFSLKETIMLTHRTGDFNEYQVNGDAFALKSKIGVKYKASKTFKPGFAFEMRTQLNGPWGYTYGSQATNASGNTYYPYKHTGYSHAYNDRYRFSLTGDIKLSANHTLTPYLLYDIYSEYELDTNSSGERLFSAAYADYNKFTFGISYVFSF